ncbi:MAG: preprotein translocase subunit SecA [Paludibacteraceae bacterium]|nr:preprotein translocase subunit SecA [Paludibacteraceae bacterium]
MAFNITSLLKKILGSKSERDMKEITPFVELIKAEYPAIQSLSNDELRAKSAALRQEIAELVAPDKEKIKQLKEEIEQTEIDKREKIFNEIDQIEKDIQDKYDKKLDEIMPVVFAIVKDTARRFLQNEETVVTANDFDRNLAAKPSNDFIRIEGDKAIYKNEWTAGGNKIKWDMCHYDVQLFGGVVLHKGKIAEMATGEGKTLVATLPVFLNALTGEGVHMVTVNDYLAKRDSEWMGPLYMFHGISVDCIDKYEPNSQQRRDAYNADITFGTNNEFGFDYLRDNMATSPLDLVQRKHNYAIVDEVDSVLIDDARTPLIISGPVSRQQADQLFDELRPVVENLVNLQRNLATNYLTEAKRKMASQDKKEQEEGEVALFRSYKALPKNTPLIKYLSEQGVKKRMQKTEEFFMQENNKNMHVATDPLYFVIDEKNKTIELTDKGIDQLSKSKDDPQFFVLPDVGSEVAEIKANASLSDNEKREREDALMQKYSAKAEILHVINQLLKAYTLFYKDEEYIVSDGKVLIVDEQTGRIMDGRRYSDGLHQAIEAKERVKVEAATQTFATITLQNYFRMYHKLAGMTGTAETEAGEFWNIYKLDVVVIPTNKPIARIDMDDRIYRTKREKYNAVIEEVERLINEGRPVLVGTTSVEISELLSRMLTLRHIKHNVLNAKLHQKEADIVAQAGMKGTVTIATNMAGRGTDIKLSDEIKEKGGLAIIGTERHESRRVDRQLRGRAGRQGDPGSSVFYASIEDNLMRLFANERIAGLLDRLGFKEGEMITHPWISKSIEKAQKKVEENNFGIRKRLLEYDDVMNKQRTVIYQRRRHALMGERIGVDIANMFYDATALMADVYGDDYQALAQEALEVLCINLPFSEEDLKTLKPGQVANRLYDAALESFKRRMDHVVEVANPVIQRVFEEKGQQYQNILVPFTDGKRVFQISVNLKKAAETQAREVVKEFEKTILLYVIDDNWKEHLRALDELRSNVQNATYEQKDPLLIYKLESYNLFKTMVDTVNRSTLSILMRGQIPMPDPEQVRQAMPEQRTDRHNYQERKDEAAQVAAAQRQASSQDTRAQQKQQPVHVEKKIGRNDPCPCGSGKKYKNCHGKGIA